MMILSSPFGETDLTKAPITVEPTDGACPPGYAPRDRCIAPEGRIAKSICINTARVNEGPIALGPCSESGLEPTASGFWAKYKWWIIGGVVVLAAGTGTVIYVRRKKS